MDIPNELFDIYKEGITALLNSNAGSNCVLVLPPKRNECPNCIVNTISGVSASRYKSGGPRPFQNGQICPWCQSKGYIESNYESSIKILIDWEPKESKDALTYYNSRQSNSSVETLLFPAGIIKVQGFISDLKTMKQAVEIKINDGVATNNGYWRYVKYGEPIPYSLEHNDFFSCILKRVG